LILIFKILTALKGWVGQAAKRTGALHNNYRSRALHIILTFTFTLLHNILYGNQKYIKKLFFSRPNFTRGRFYKILRKILISSAIFDYITLKPYEKR